MSSEKLRWVWGAIPKMRRGCRIRDFIHAAWLTHCGRNPLIDHDLYHEFIEEFKGQGPRRWCHPQPPASARIEKTRIGCRIWSNNLSLGGHLELNLSQQLRLGKGPSLWDTVPYGLRARETMALWDNMFDSTPARNNYGLRIPGERSGGKKQF